MEEKLASQEIKVIESENYRLYTSASKTFLRRRLRASKNIAGKETLNDDLETASKSIRYTFSSENRIVAKKAINENFKDNQETAFKDEMRTFCGLNEPPE